MILDFEIFNRWILMAKHTLEAAINDLNGGFYNWCCFKCHQVAEFALKAFLYGIGKEAFGHSLTHLLKRIQQVLEVELCEEIVQACSTLDKYYIPTRYVNVWSEGIPYEYFTKQDCEQAIKYARLVLEFIENLWKKLLMKEKEKERK